MSDAVVLKAEVRQKVGSKATAGLRAQGKMPVVVYGHKQDAVSVSVDSHSFVENLHHGNRVFNLELEGKSETVLLKDVQYDHFGSTVIHADLVRVDLTEKVSVSVGLDLKGTSIGVNHGGIIDELVTEIEVACVVTSIPESIAVNIKDINIGDVLKAGDIELPSGVELLSDPEMTVLTCHEAAATISAEDEAESGEEASEPEVITEKNKEEAEG